MFLVAVLQRVITIISEVLTLTQGNTLTQSVIIDSTLGLDTMFVFDYTDGDITPGLTSPSGVAFPATSDVVTHDSVLQTYSFSIPDDDFEVRNTLTLFP